MSQPRSHLSPVEKAAILFLGIAFLGALPVISVSLSPTDGLGGLGEGIVAELVFMFVTVPSAGLSIACAIPSIRRIKVTFLSVLTISVLLLGLIYVLVLSYIGH